jgi:2-polyprenyl-3-methyl-5-hydroxy-6-metoxy-1,4-benzoquinol methylase
MPSPAEVRAHYDHYYLTRSADNQALEELIRLHEPIATQLLGRLGADGARKVLDYGFGSGAFLILLASLDHSVTGADVSRQNITQLRQYCSSNDLSMTLVDLSCSGLEELRESRFDLITLFQVVEHMTDPLLQLRQLSALQSEGGCVYVECPNDDAFLAWAKKFTRVSGARKKFWRSLKYPEHLHGFNRQALQCLLEKSGYQVESCGDYHYRDGVHQVEAHTWWPRLRDNPSPCTAYGLSRSIIPVVDRVMSRLFGAGSGLYAFARKAR